MNRQAYVAEVITPQHAAIEFDKPLETALLLLVMSRLARRIDFSTISQPRFVWYHVLRANPVFELYGQMNKMVRSNVDMARRSVRTFELTTAIARHDAIVSRFSRPKERLQSVRDRLVRIDCESRNIDVRDLPGSLRDDLEVCEILAPEIWFAWFKIRPDYIMSQLLDDSDVPPLRVCDFIAALDIAIAHRCRRGSRRKVQRHWVHERIRDDYLWLTGSISPGPGYRDFQRSIYSSVGIPAPSEGMLRGARRGTLLMPPHP